MKIYAFAYDPDNQIIKCYCKAHPGAPCVLDIEKSPWER